MKDLKKLIHNFLETTTGKEIKEKYWITLHFSDGSDKRTFVSTEMITYKQHIHSNKCENACSLTSKLEEPNYIKEVVCKSYNAGADSFTIKITHTW